MTRHAPPSQDNEINVLMNTPAGETPARYRAMAIGPDLTLDFNGTEDDGVDLGLLTTEDTSTCRLRVGQELDFTSRPGWMRVHTNRLCDQYSTRGDLGMLLRDAQESQFVETAIDWATAWRSGAGMPGGSGTPPTPGSNGLDYGLVIFDKVAERQVMQVTCRVRDGVVTVNINRFGATVTGTPTIVSYSSEQSKVIYLRIERYSRGNRQFAAFYKTSKTASWTRIVSASEGTLRATYTPWNTEIENLQYGMMFKTFGALPIAGGSFVADVDYLRFGQWFDDDACPDRPRYGEAPAPTAGTVATVPVRGLRHGMYRYQARSQAVAADGTRGPWSAPSTVFTPTNQPGPVMTHRGGNANQLVSNHVRFLVDMGTYKTRDASSKQLTHLPGVRPGSIARRPFQNELGGTGSNPIVEPRRNFDHSAAVFGWDNKPSALRRGGGNGIPLRPGGEEFTVMTVFRHTGPYRTQPNFLWAGGSRTATSVGWSAQVGKDGSVGVRAASWNNRGARRIPGFGHNMPQLLVVKVEWRSFGRCLSVRVNGDTSGSISNGFYTIPESATDSCTSDAIFDNGDGFMFGSKLDSAGALSDGLNGEAYFHMMMNEEDTEFRDTANPSLRFPEAMDDYLARRYYLKCSPYEAPRVSARTGFTRGFGASEACRREQWNAGWCQETCQSGTTLTLGNSRRDCKWGAWDASPPVCSAMCAADDSPDVVRGGATGCTDRLFSTSFDTADVVKAGELILGMRALPHVPDYAMARHFDLSSGSALHAKTLEPSCTQPADRFLLAPDRPSWETAVSEHSATATVTLHPKATLQMPRSQAGVAVRVSGDGTSFYALEIAHASHADANGTRTVRLIKKQGASATETVLAFADAAAAPIAIGTPYILRLHALPGGRVVGAVHLAANATIPVPSSAVGARWARVPASEGSPDITASLGPVLVTLTHTDDAPIVGGTGGISVIGEATFDDLSIEAPCDAQTGGTTCRPHGRFGGCARRCGPGYSYGGGSPVRTCGADGSYADASVAPVTSAPLGDLVCVLEPPTVSAAGYVLEVEEGAPVNAAVGGPLAFAVASPELSVEYTLLDDAEGMFKIGRCSGQVIVGRASLDFETRQTYNVTVSAVTQDPAGTKSAAAAVNITVRVTNRNEPPTWADGLSTPLETSVAENATVGTAIVTLSAVDPDGPGDPIAFELLVAGPSATAFVVDNVTGVVTVGPGGPDSIDFETGEPLLRLLARAYDPRDASRTLSTTRFVEVSVLNSPDPPRFQELTDPAERYISSTATVAGGAAGDALSAVDQDSLVFTEAEEGAANGTAAESTILRYSVVSGGLDPADGSQLLTVGETSGLVLFVKDISTRYGPTSEDKGVSPAGRPYLDAFSVRVRVADVTGLTDEVDVSVFVISNSSVRGIPVITSVELAEAGPFSDPTAFERLASRGGDVIRIVGENFAAPNSIEPISLNLTLMGPVPDVVFSSMACRHVSPTLLNCTTPPGIGRVRATVGISDRIATPSVGASLELRYAAPDVTLAVYGAGDAFGAEGPDTSGTGSGADGALSTRGGDLVSLIGSSFGPEHPKAAEFLRVRYGPPAEPARYSATVTAVRSAPAGSTSAFESAVVARVEAGVGSNLIFALQVAGAEDDDTAETSTLLSYERPVLTRLLPADASVVLQSLRTAGGQGVVLRGTGFGPARSDGSSSLSAKYSASLRSATPSPTDELLDSFGATGCRPAPASFGGDSHTAVVCTTAPGVGSGLGWVAVVETVVSTTEPASPDDVVTSYAAPVIVEVYGPGKEGADTRGGDLVFLRGTDFPPPSTPTGMVTASYGRYEARDCEPRSLGADSVGVVQCTLDQGTGRDHQWRLRVAGLQSPWTTSGNTSYAAPTLSEFLGDDVFTAETRGRTPVTIRGSNFGPNVTDPSTRRLLRVAATYQSRLAQASSAARQGMPPSVLGSNGTLTFSATDCVMTAAHTELRCLQAEGAGVGFAWTVMVDGQASGAPRTSYAAPSVTAVLAADGASPAGPADTAGGTVFVLAGANFGPPPSAAPFGSLVQSVRFGASGSERAVRGWEVVSHDMLRVTVPAGLGSGLRFTVLVADQPSALSPPFSYAPPVVRSVAPAVVDASASDAQRRIVIRGTNLGVVAASGGAIYAALGVPASAADAGVGDTVALVPARSARVLPPGEASVAGEQELIVDVARGTGPTRPVRVVAVPASEADDGSDGASAARDVADARRFGASVSSVPGSGFVSGTDAFDYAAPEVSNVIVSRPLNPADLNASRALLPASAQSFARIVLIQGRGFGVSPPAVYSSAAGTPGAEESDVRRYADVQYTDGFGRPRVETAGVTGAAQLSSDVFVLGWTDSDVRVLSAVTDGSIRVRVATRGFAWSQEERASAYVRFNALAPQISALVGAETPFPTTGGTSAAPLEMRATNLGSTTRLEVRVGGRDCPLVGPAGQALTATAAGTLMQQQFADALAAGTPADLVAFTIRCVVPPGQGANVPVVVYRDDDPSPPSGAGVSYTAPTVVRVTAHDAPAVLGASAPGPARSAWPATAIVEVPTTRAVVRVEGSNLGPCPVVFLGDSASFEVCDPATNTPVAAARLDPGHTWVEVPAPPGEGRGTNFAEIGPQGFAVRLVAGDQPASPARVPMQYARPTIVAIQGSPTPALGGVVVLTGRDFGQGTRGALDASPPVVSILVPASSRAGVGAAPARSVPCTSVFRSADHTSLNCTVPPGTGSRLVVSVAVADLAPVMAPVRLGYAAPVVASWSSGPASASARRSLASASGGPSDAASPPTDGTHVMTVVGSHFGAFDPVSSCVFVSWSAASRSEAAVQAGTPQTWWAGTAFQPATAPAAPLNCSGEAEWRGEGELTAGEVLAWSDASVRFIVPPGVGTRSVWVVARGNAPPAPLVLRYAAPSFGGAVMTPTAASPDGTEVVVITGASNLGPPAAATLDQVQALALLGFPMPIAAERSLPTASVVINVSTACVTDATGLTVAGGALPELRRCGSPASSSRPGGGSVVARSHTTVSLLPPVGVGTGHRVGVFVVEAGRVIAASAASLTLDFRPPTVVGTDPTRVEMDGDVVPSASVAAALGDSSGRLASAGGTVGSSSVPPAVDCSVIGAGISAAQAMREGELLPGFGDDTPTKRLLVEVANAGVPPTDLCDTSQLPWSPLARVLNVTVERRACSSARRVTARGRAYVECDLPNTPVGFHDVSVFAAGQRGVLAATHPSALHVVCDASFYGRPAELCLPCPRGADCRGYDPDLEAAETPQDAAVLADLSAGRATANESTSALLRPYVYPRPTAGFFDLNASDMLPACPFSDRVNGRAVCITPCEPKFACTGDNQCLVGYRSTAPEFRCNSCAGGYYRRAGICEKCPDNPEVLFIVIGVAAIGAAAAAWWLNRVGAAISFIQIGVDYMQVLAIFSSARIQWPPALRELLSLLSAFNLNLEITAPECLIPDIAAVDKWFAFQAVPLCVALVLALSFGVQFCFNICVKNRKWRDAMPAADRSINLAFVFMYVMYLQATKTSLDALSCIPTEPPQYDEAGTVITYLQMVFEPCAKPGGVHQTLLPWAIIALCVYSVGYPLVCILVLWRHWSVIYFDQLLRAKGTGDTESSNPHLDIRHRFGRVYFFFKPTRAYWILVLLGRKFFIALVALWFAQNPAYQLALTLLVLFVAFALQVRLSPFMSAPERSSVLVEHQARAAADPRGLDARLASTLDRLDDKGRRKSTFSRGLDASNARSMVTSLGSMVVGSVLVSANGVEVTMLFSAVLVTVSGLLFESGRLDAAFYADQRDALTGFVIGLVSLSLVYFVIVLVVEMRALCANARAAESRAAPPSRAERGKKKAASGGVLGGILAAVAGSGAGGGTDSAVIAAAANAGRHTEDESAVSNQSNPLFVKGGGSDSDRGSGSHHASASTTSVATALVTLEAPPDASQWVLYKDTLQRLQERVAELQREKGELLRAGLGEATDTSRRASVPRRVSIAAGGRGDGKPRTQFGQALVGGGAAADGSAAASPKGGQKRGMLLKRAGSSRRSGAAKALAGKGSSKSPLEAGGKE